MNITTANRLVEYRKQRGLSQEDLAAALGLSRQAVSKWERAEASPDTDNLIALARLYGVSLDTLLLSEEPVQATQPSPEPPLADHAAQGVDSAAVELGDFADSVEAEVMGQVQDAISFDTTQRRQLSPGARALLRGGALVVGMVFFFAYGLLSMIFPPMRNAYAIICTLIYLGGGFLFDIWHPTWIIYLTVPLFQMMFGG